MNTAYVASFAKVSALSKYLLDSNDYNALLHKNNVGEVAAYLKHNTVYGEVLSGVSEYSVHRGELEEYVRTAASGAIEKLSHFMQGSAHAFMKIYTIEFEISTIKLIMRSINSDSEFVSPLYTPDYFKRRMSIDPDALVRCKTIPDFIKRLSGTPYHRLLMNFAANDTVNMFEIEITLDIYYYKTIWSLIKRSLTGEDKACVMKIIGTHIDLLNMLWIFRCINYYNAAKEIIYAYLIPVRYKLKRSDIVRFIESDGTTGLALAFADSYYSDVFTKDPSVFHEQNVNQYLFHICEQLYIKKPFTIAKVISYLHIKQAEIENLIKIIEGVRYSLDMNEITRYLIRRKGGQYIGY